MNKTKLCIYDFQSEIKCQNEVSRKAWEETLKAKCIVARMERKVCDCIKKFSVDLLSKQRWVVRCTIVAPLVKSL